jgi:predicted esterase
MKPTRGVAILLLVAVSAATARAVPFDDPNGDTHVVCSFDPGQSYELYVPASAPKTNSPILYAFDPRGDGKGVLKSLAEVAATNGWILAASNNSRSGPWEVIFAAQDAMVRDTEARLSLHPTRRFAAGFSGGARASLALAFRNPHKICGVLCMGAGWPLNTDLTPTDRSLVVKILVGNRDRDICDDVPRTQGRLAKAKVRCDVSTFEGDHVWPPAPAVLSAAQWLNENAETPLNRAIRQYHTFYGDCQFVQTPPMPGRKWGRWKSDSVSRYFVCEDFQGVQRPITSVGWWGINAIYHAQSQYWLPCEPVSDEFDISLYPDQYGRPGPAVHSETLKATRFDTMAFYNNNFHASFYSVKLSEPVNLASGWVMIKNIATPEGAFMWLSSPQGNKHSLQYYDPKGSIADLDTDFAVCLAGEGAEPTAEHYVVASEPLPVLPVSRPSLLDTALRPPPEGFDRLSPPALGPTGFDPSSSSRPAIRQTVPTGRLSPAPSVPTPQAPVATPPPTYPIAPPPVYSTSGVFESWTLAGKIVAIAGGVVLLGAVATVALLLRKHESTLDS